MTCLSRLLGCGGQLRPPQSAHKLLRILVQRLLLRLLRVLLPGILRIADRREVLVCPVTRLLARFLLPWLLERVKRKE